MGSKMSTMGAKSQAREAFGVRRLYYMHGIGSKHNGLWFVMNFLIYLLCLNSACSCRPSAPVQRFLFVQLDESFGICFEVGCLLSVETN